MSDARARARDLARESIARGNATGWFEQLYAESERDGFAISWVDVAPNSYLVDWLARNPAPGSRALVVGCGYGDDAELLASRGLEVVAFDVAPSAIARCRSRFPGSSVEYEVADVLGRRRPGRLPSTSSSRRTRSRSCPAKLGVPPPARSAGSWRRAARFSWWPGRAASMIPRG